MFALTSSACVRGSTRMVCSYSRYHRVRRVRAEMFVPGKARSASAGNVMHAIASAAAGAASMCLWLHDLVGLSCQLRTVLGMPDVCRSNTLATDFTPCPYQRLSIAASSDRPPSLCTYRVRNRSRCACKYHPCGRSLSSITSSRTIAHRSRCARLLSSIPMLMIRKAELAGLISMMQALLRAFVGINATHDYSYEIRAYHHSRGGP